MSNKETIMIAYIKVGSRFRKDLGDIDCLAQSIQEIGLLHPVVINENNELIAGQRRIEAYKKLGRKEIPCRVLNISDLIKGEFIENTARKDFTFSERQAILQEIERQRIGHRVSKESSANLQTFQKDNKGKPSVNIVADYTGLSPRQLSKEKDVYIHAKSNPEEFGYLIEELDNGDITVNAAVGKIRAHYDEKRKLEQAAIVKKRREEQQDEKQKRQRPRQQQQQQQTRIDNPGDYDPTKRDSYDRQTLYNVIDWLLEQNRMLREANRNLRANKKRAANDNSTTTSNKGGADV
jgi:ParB-like nuclease domain